MSQSQAELMWRNIEGVDVYCTKEDTEEIKRYKSQPRFQIERDQRRESFNRAQSAARDAFIIQQNVEKVEFERAERQRDTDMLEPFVGRLALRGIDQVRLFEVPAYTFTRFLELPKELQLKILFMVARAQDPLMHSVASLDEGAPWTRSSSIFYKTQFVPHLQQPPALLHVSRAIRADALQMYTLFECMPDIHSQLRRQQTYVNTDYDTFYVYGSSWLQVKVFIDLVITRYTTRQLKAIAQSGIDDFRKIHHLAVDLNVFSSAPRSIWADLCKVELLTLVIHPTKVVLVSPEYDPWNVRFARPVPGSKHGKRAEWVLQTATRILEETKRELNLAWKLPAIEVVVKLTGDEDVDWVVDGTLAAVTYRTRMEFMVPDDAVISTESAWFEEAEACMVSDVSKETIRSLKKQFLPSRYVQNPEEAEKTSRCVGQYFTDSETESGQGLPFVTFSEEGDGGWGSEFE